MSSPRPALSATVRTVTGKKVAALRREGKLPAVVYGHGVESRHLSVDAHEFDLLRRKIGPTTLIDLKVDGGSATPVLLHGVGTHPITRKPQHLDLFQVRMSEELTVDVQVVFTGESLAVTRGGGTLAHALETVKVKALPDKLPQQLTISVDPIVDFDTKLHVKDLTLPAGVTLLTDPEELLAHVLAPRVEEVETPTAAPAESGAPAAETPAASESEG